MSIDIEIRNGDVSWPVAKPLIEAVWPLDARSSMPWAHIAFANPEFRVLVEAEGQGLVCHVGLYRRQATLDGRPVNIGGIGGVATRDDHRRQGLATIALNAAIQTLKDEGSMGFALLFCEPNNFDFYRNRGWHPFEGEILAQQPSGHGRFDAIAPFVFDLVQRPRRGVIDLRGLPW